MSAAPVCPSRTLTRALVARREEDLLTREDDRLLREHLAACPACRAEAVRLDPTLLFAPLAAASDDARRASRRALEADAAAVTADVLAAVEVARARRRIEAPVAWWRRPVVRTGLRAASLALVSGGLIAFLSSRSRDVVRPGPSVAARVTRAAEPAALDLPSAPGTSEARAAVPLIEGLKSPGATIYQFAGGAGQPNIVFVVDRNADL